MAAGPATMGAGAAATEPIALQDTFDPLPDEAEVQTGRGRRFVDTGPRGSEVLVFFGGLGTSAGACLLTEFARRTREHLGLRMLSVERAGFGLTPPDAAWGYAEAAADARAVLDALGIERYRIAAISGGGPYAAALAAAAPDRVVSLHLAAAAAGPLIGETTDSPLSAASIAAIVRDPEAWWRYPDDSPVHRIPGFQAAAGAEGRRALAAHGEVALAHEWARLCTTPLPDLSAVRAPAYVYWGSADELVSPAHAAAWLDALPNVAAARRYLGEGHDIQYRHWDQILVDAARGPGSTLVCREGRTWLVPDDAVPADATLGLCCWSERMRA